MLVLPHAHVYADWQECQPQLTATLNGFNNTEKLDAKPFVLASDSNHVSILAVEALPNAVVAAAFH
jgi:hypothetical protein